MHEFDGDLLIGGLRLKHVHGELEMDEPLANSSDHLLSGKLNVDETQKAVLECGRRYRLQIDDGPAGQVIVSRINDGQDHSLTLEFEPMAAANNPPSHRPR
jgi:hypothetical protein